jgi:prophage regulatory protein
MATIRILRRPELLSIIGVSRSTLYSWISNGLFPRPVRIGPNAVGWTTDDVSAWLRERRVSECNL